jgi:hypothetical protein
MMVQKRSMANHSAVNLDFETCWELLTRIPNWETKKVELKCLGSRTEMDLAKDWCSTKANPMA